MNNSILTRFSCRGALTFAGLALGVFLLAAVGIRFAVAKAGLDHLPVTTDEAIVVLMAKQILQGELPLVAMAQPYQFPLESYLMAPFVELMPRNAFGARFLSFIAGGLTLGLLLGIAWKLAPAGRRWPMAALILFPSAYLLMIQLGYSLPHNNSSLVMCLASALLAMTIPTRPSLRSAGLVFLIGALCGLAFTNNMVVLSLILPIGIVALTRAGLKGLFAHLPPYALGLGLGLIPYLAGMYLLPGAQTAVAGTRALSEGLSRIWSPTLSFTLPRGMGVDPTTFPDTTNLLGFGEGFALTMTVFFCLVLLGATACSIWKIGTQMARGAWPVLGGTEIFVGTAWLTLAAFLMSSRANGHSFRYLFPLLFTFPFLVGAVYASVGKWFRHALGAAVVLVVVLNVATTFALLSAWKEPEHAARVAGTPDLKPALAYLRDNGFEHCIASHWMAYRITFLTDEEIICAQPMNERFPGWPIPYKDDVDQAERVAFVLTERARFLTPGVFERNMEQMSVTAQRVELGDVIVYHDFSLPPAPEQEQLLDPGLLTATALHQPEDARLLVDGDIATRWDNRRLQESGEWVQIEWPEDHLLSKIILDYTCYHHDRAMALNFSIRTAEGWTMVKEAVPDALQPFVFAGNRPDYGRIVQGYRLDAIIPGNAVRIEIADPNTARNWDICQIEIYVATPSADKTGAPVREQNRPEP
ncbi:hypothetical protein [Desulfonatronum sp. SC1]|uniref:hypothetical protein n=1 Tax=Desulfonatronum sp. SC1 TaxID=2109626 RepID=UPI000D30C6B8|nr:hypothetical protein [Desulfonatronum sp. SC1]PTN36506.1 hypothetical protein C6366_09285 [Desulfonatronum sp. SC1]